MGIALILLGCRWMVVDEPWMLDEVANIERLNMTFNELFSPEINKTLPGYLRQIYRFFGFWVMLIGGFLTAFSTPDLVNSHSIRIRLLICLGFMMGIGTILGYFLIPSSHFIYIIWIMNLIYIYSIYIHSRLKNKT